MVMVVTLGKTVSGMKKYLSIAVLVALVTVACTQVEEQNTTTFGRKLDSFSALINNDQTRTYAVQGADGSIQMLWHEQDAIAVSDMKALARYKLSSGVGTTDAIFTVDANSSDVTFTENAPLYAISPYARAFYTEADELFIQISTAQTHTGEDGDNDLRRNIMLGTTTDNGESFDFTLVGALARFSIAVGEGEVIRSVNMTTETVNLTGNATIDWSNKRLLEASSKSVTLNYTNAPKSPYSDGYALIAPVDFSMAEGKVYYEVMTDKGVYTFCKKPAKKFEAGYIYNFPLDITKFEKVGSYNDLADGKYCFESLHIAMVRATDSTISIGWTNSVSNRQYLSDIDAIRLLNLVDYTADKIKTYKVALYRDMACQNLVVSVDNIVASSVYNTEQTIADPSLSDLLPPRFVFPGLIPNTTYYAKVFNITDNTESRVLEVKTTDSVVNRSSVVRSGAKAGDLILFENFEKLVYGGELSSRSAGLSRTDRGSLTDIAPVSGAIRASNEGFYMVGGGTEMGLFNTLKGVLDEIGVQNWGYIGSAAGSICARPGCLKIGTSGNRSFVCTHALTAIPKGKAATVKVQFKAAPYADLHRTTLNHADERMIAVKALSGVTFGSNYVVTYTTEEDVANLRLSGTNVSVWEECEVELENLPSGGVVAIGGGRNSATASNRFQLDDIRIIVTDVYDYVAPEEPEEIVRPAVSGTVIYSDGTPAVGVSVSDGYTVVQTDAKGKYTIAQPHKDAWYIYYSTPADCEVNINEFGQPCFFTKYSENVSTYDFTLTKLTGGKETKFALFCLADPQCMNDSHSWSYRSNINGDRFENESVADIVAHARTKTTPCYGVTLGDIVYSEGSRDDSNFMDEMRGYMAKNKIGMPVFQTMGNHDYTFFSSSRPIAADETSSTYNIKAQRAFEDVFGPINHSWNRGDVHIVCMRNMQWNSNTNAKEYSSPIFTNEQVEWLRQDLSFVPKDKLVILCVHVPILNKTSNVISLLKPFAEAHIMSGHTHYMRNEPTRSGGIYEHVHAAVSGQWWRSNINGDGCPNGYGVYDIDGNTIRNWYYKGVNPGMNDRDYQIRLYRGDLICGGSRAKFTLNHGNDVIIANVFNADSSWKVELYEDGQYSGEMEFIPEKKYVYTGTTVVDTDSCQDWWAIGYHIGVQGCNDSYYTNCFHMYKYKLKNPAAKKIEVKATDCFGTTYTATEIISNSPNGAYNSGIYTGVPFVNW